MRSNSYRYSGIDYRISLFVTIGNIRSTGVSSDLASPSNVSFFVSLVGSYMYVCMHNEEQWCCPYENAINQFVYMYIVLLCAGGDSCVGKHDETIAPRRKYK